jgi:CRISPR-associated exonuclease Cas4
MMIDGEWGSNYKIVQGDLLHEKVDNPFYDEKRGDVFRSRSVPVYSDTLNIYGVCDMVEFEKSETGVNIGTREGLWNLKPVEYKNGTREKSGADELQLLAQAVCLEEMFGVKIETGSIFYGKNKRRTEVDFNEQRRDQLAEIIAMMNQVIIKTELLRVPENQNCSLCSLIEICLPRAFKKKRTIEKQIKSLVSQGNINA